MSRISKQTTLIALFLMSFLLLGSMAAQARDRRDTDGADHVKKGAVIGAVVGVGSQVVRGNRRAGELVTGGAVGALIGAGIGSYVDYKEEKDARQDDDRRDRRDYRTYRGGDRYRRYDARDNYRPRAPRGYQRSGHRHNRNCHHR